MISFLWDTVNTIHIFQEELTSEKKFALSESAISDFGGLECVDLSHPDLKENPYLIGFRTRFIYFQSHWWNEEPTSKIENYLRIARMCPNLEILYYIFGLFPDESLIEILKNCPLISKICISCGYSSDVEVIEISKWCKNLTSLSLHTEFDSQVSDIGLRAIFKECTKMESLSIYDKLNCFSNNSYSEISQLSSLQQLYLSSDISNETFIQIANGCKNLKSLRVQSVILSEYSFLEVGKLCPEITHLELPTYNFCSCSYLCISKYSIDFFLR